MKINTHQIPTLLQQIQTSEDGSKAQKSYFEQLLLLTQQLLNKIQYNRFNISDVEDAKNETLMAICGGDRYCNTINKTTILNFLQTLPKAINSQQIITRYKTYISRICKNKLLYQFRRQKFLFFNFNFEIDCIYTPRLTGIDRLIAEEETALITAITDYINNDTEGLLNNCYPQGYPQANAQELLQVRLLGKTAEKWKAIALRFNIPYGTLTSHYKRKCLPLIRSLFIIIDERG